MPSFNQANGSVTQQGLTDGQLTSHLCGGLTPAGLQTEGVGAEPGINRRLHVTTYAIGINV